MRRITAYGIPLVLALGAFALADAQTPTSPNPPMTCPGPDDHLISTDAPKHLNKNCVRVSKKLGNIIYWKARAGHGTLMSLDFTSTDEPNKVGPFASCLKIPCTVNCAAGTCSSLNINPNLDLSKGARRYSYTPNWANAPQTGAADPDVMIDP